MTTDPTAARKAENFLAFTRKYGWVVVRDEKTAWGGYPSVPGKYVIHDKDIFDRQALPAVPQHTRSVS